MTKVQNKTKRIISRQTMLAITLWMVAAMGITASPSLSKEPGDLIVIPLSEWTSKPWQDREAAIEHFWIHTINMDLKRNSVASKLAIERGKIKANWRSVVWDLKTCVDVTAGHWNDKPERKNTLVFSVLHWCIGTLKWAHRQ